MSIRTSNEVARRWRNYNLTLVDDVEFVCHSPSIGNTGGRLALNARTTARRRSLTCIPASLIVLLMAANAILSGTDGKAGLVSVD
jgi:hypothetical protein